MLAGGVSTSFDLVVQPKTGQAQEFRNLPKAELHPLLAYIAGTRLTVQDDEEDLQTEERQPEPAGSSSEVRIWT